jgi:hypothetical protein
MLDHDGFLGVSVGKEYPVAANRFESELSVPDGQAWFVLDAKGKITAFRLKDAAEAQKQGGETKDFEAAKLSAWTSASAPQSDDPSRAFRVLRSTPAQYRSKYS